MGKLIYWGSGLGVVVLMLRMMLWLACPLLGLVEHLVGNSRRRHRARMREERKQTKLLEQMNRLTAARPPVTIRP